MLSISNRLIELPIGSEVFQRISIPVLTMQFARTASQKGFQGCLNRRRFEPMCLYPLNYSARAQTGESETKKIKIVDVSWHGTADLANHESLSVGLHAKPAVGRTTVRNILRIVGSHHLRITDVANLVSLSIGIPEIAVKMWDTVEDLMVERFSAPAGNPQDAFFATVDQALVIQNDPTYQSWLKSNDAALFSRLAAIDDPKKLTEEMTWSILGRQPDDEEIKMVTEILQQNSTDRETTIRELVWGLLASSEFRFYM